MRYAEGEEIKRGCEDVRKDVRCWDEERMDAREES